MPETEYECISKEWLQTELRAKSAAFDTKDLIILDCRSSHEYSESHIRSAVNFSIPSIMLRRLAAGKINLLATIKSPELKERIQNGYKVSLFILYNDVDIMQLPQLQHQLQQSSSQEMGTAGAAIGDPMGSLSTGSGGSDSTINVLHKRLKQDGCRVVSLQDGFSSFRQAFPEWCEDDGLHNKEMESSRNTQADQLMGLRSLRISTPHSDSACSSSAESSDCESSTHHHNFNEAPVEIIPGLFLGNASHSCDSNALQKYNIKYVLNVTPDLPNVFEEPGGIQYLQIPITDHYSQDLAMHFPAAIQFIEEARAKNSAVLVHCLAGVSRSVTVTLAYLMHTRALSLNDAFSLVRARKPDVSPNFHFMQQLHSFETQLRVSPSECTAMDESGGGGSGSSSSSSSGSVNVNSIVNAAATGAGVVAACCGCKHFASECQVSSESNCSVLDAGKSPATVKFPMDVYFVPAFNGAGSKFSCNCIAADCKCMQTGGYMAQLAKATGISPDSGIEFDRWTSSSDTGLK